MQCWGRPQGVETQRASLLQPGVAQEYLKADTAPRLRSPGGVTGPNPGEWGGRHDKIVSAIKITRSRHLFQQMVIGHLCVPGILIGTGDPVVERR